MARARYCRRREGVKKTLTPPERSHMVEVRSENTMAEAAPGPDLTIDDESSAERVPEAPLVVVVDDDDAGRYALVHPLRRAGFRVADAATGADASSKSSGRPRSSSTSTCRTWTAATSRAS
jgi:PleD family two-component response regulator